MTGPSRWWVLWTVLGACGFVAAASEPAYAYLDPGTGSMILQFLIAGIVGALFALKVYWQKVKGFLGRVFRRGGGSGA